LEANPKDTLNKGLIEIYADSAEALILHHPAKISVNNKQYLYQLKAEYYYYFFPPTDKRAETLFLTYIEKAKRSGLQNSVQTKYMVYPYIIAGKCYLSRQDYARAEEQFKQGFDILYRQNKGLACPEKIDILDGLTKVYTHRKDYQQAYTAQMQIDSVKDQLFNTDKSKRAMIAKIELDAERKTSELTRALSENTAHRKMIFLLSGLILALGILSYYISRSAKLKLKFSVEEHEKMEAEQQLMQLKQQQLQKAMIADKLQLSQKNEMLDHLKEKIKDGGDISIRRMLTQDAALNESFEQMNLSIQHIHPEFANIINKKAGNKLTTLDIKYCACIHLNMDTKQIAHLLAIEPHSVRVAKYRIKQKLGLNKDQSLTTYLQSIGRSDIIT